jgi:hypothetical protein
VPFTGSHPAAVVPLLRRLPPSALILGSMAPDAPYYVPVPGWLLDTHTLAAVVSSDLVIGVVAFVLWQVLLGPAVVAFAPAALRRRLPSGVPAGLRHHFRSVRAAALVLLALVVGAWTHVFWDSFTHGGMWGAEHVAWLRTHYHWAQDASTVVGGLVVAAVAMDWWRRNPPHRVARTHPLAPLVWVTVAVATVAAGLYGFVSTVHWTGGPSTPFFAGATNAITAGLGVVTVAALAHVWIRVRSAGARP